jgi:hypothetical protein
MSSLRSGQVCGSARIFARVDDFLLPSAHFPALLAELAQPVPSSQRLARTLAADPHTRLAVHMLAQDLGVAPSGALSLLHVHLQELEPGLLAGLVVAVHLQTCCGSDQEGLWSTGLQVARRAVAAAGPLPAGTRCLLLMTSLLHDAGHLVLGSQGVGLREEVQEAVRSGLSLIEAERAVHGCDHAVLGAALFARWRLPDILVEAVARHHCPAVGDAPVADLLATIIARTPGERP